MQFTDNNALLMKLLIVFHDYNKEKLLSEIKKRPIMLSKKGISLNPILLLFSKRFMITESTVNLIDTFLHSIEMDLQKIDF